MPRIRHQLHVEPLEARNLLSVVSGVVFEDLNDNGQRDASEPGRAGWEVQLLDNSGVIVQSKLTDADGAYAFNGVTPGKYVVREIVQAGWRQTMPADAAVQTADVHLNQDGDDLQEPEDCGCGDATDAKPKKTSAEPPAGDRVGGLGAEDLLPDLTVDLQRGLGDWYIDGNEIRFSQATPNIGAGPMELRGGPVQGNQQQVFQRIRTSDGGSRDRLAGVFIFHPEHGHIHFDGYSQYHLRQALADTNGDGVPEPGAVVATGGKVSFCLLDSAVYNNSLPGFRPTRGYNSCGQVQGISVGWEDIYDAELEGQSIDITNVLPGRYFLEAIVDPDNALLEANENNNVGRVLITIPNLGRVGTYTIQVQAGVDEPDIDFGNFKYVRIAGQVFNDLNADGFKDASEPGLANRTVYLDQNNNGRFDSGQATTASTDVPKSVPDGGMTTSNLTVVDGGTILDVNVKLSINHTFDGDVRVYLISPNLTRVELIRNRGGSANNFVGTILDDETNTAIGNGQAPFTGRFKPESSLTAFDGESSTGTWTLEVRDTRTNDVGSLQNWSVEITYEEPHVHTNAAGKFAFDTLGIGTHTVRAGKPKGWQQTTTNPDDLVATTSGAALTGVSFGSFNVPPQVVGVAVKVPNKPAVAIPVGSGAQLEPLTIGDITKLIITFSEPVQVKSGDLNLGNVKEFKYDVATYMATWTFNSRLPTRQIQLNLSDNVKDKTGVALDGEWDNPTDVQDPASDTFPSGNGVPGGRFIFRFVVGQKTGTSAISEGELAAVVFSQRKRHSR